MNLNNIRPPVTVNKNNGLNPLNNKKTIPVKLADCKPYNNKNKDIDKFLDNWTKPRENNKKFIRNHLETKVF